MGRELTATLDASPLGHSKALKLLRSLARSLQEIHELGDRWDQSESRVRLTEDLIVDQIGTLAKLPTGQLDPQRDYVSPEYVASGRDDIRGDIWVWGNIAYEIITGKRPFVGKSVLETMTASLNSEAIAPMEIDPECDQQLSDIVSKTLRRDADQRFQSAKKLVEALEEVE